jgi:hypothetical protein
MPPPRPTEDMVAARAILRSGALPASERRLKIGTEIVERLAAEGLVESLRILGAVEPAHAGWALLMSGVRIARSADTLAPPAPGKRTETSFGVGLVWAGLVIAVAGDQLIASSDELATGERLEPGTDAHEARRLSHELVEAILDPVSSPDARGGFATDSVTELDKSLAGLDHWPAGWMLCTFGVWVGTGVGGIAAPLLKRRGLGFRRVTNPRRAMGGCSFAGALLAQTGQALLAESDPLHPADP